MKTTYHWLKEYCDFDWPPEELAHRLSMAGCLIEETEPIGDDVMLFADVTSNRPDHLGTIGIARDICALAGRELKLPPVDFDTAPESVRDAAFVEVEAPDLCPRYTARLIRGCKIGTSPQWLRNRLEAVGLRPVNNVVDVTNYCLYECGQPMHAFDFARLQGGGVIVRRAREGEMLISIDETKCRLTPEMLVIADAKRPVAIAGVMGGLDTEISARTSDILLESAHFEKTNNRRTSRALQLMSDSSYRFERGVDPVQVEWASRRAARLIREIAGGTICKGVIDLWTEPYRPAKVTLRFARLNHLLGMPIPPDAAVDILNRLGFDTLSRDNRAVTVIVPPFRANDVYREIDLIEEIIRIYGYDRIPETSTMTIVAGGVSKSERVEQHVREILPGLGYHETMTNAFCTETAVKLVSPWTDREALTVQNTVRRDENRLRVSILPELLRVKRTNAAHGVSRAPLFEIGRVYLPRPPRTTGKPSRDDALPDEKAVLSILSEGNLLEAKGVLETLLRGLRIAGQPRFENGEMPFFEKTMAAKIILGNRLLGVIGSVAPNVAERYDLARPPCVAELDFDYLVEVAKLEVSYHRPPAYPASERDLAIVVDESVTWAGIEACIRNLDLPNLERLAFFDVFRGKQIPEGKKSIAFSLTFRAPDRTLTREEVEESRSRAIKALEALGAQLRE